AAGDVGINVASAGHAALQLPRGATAHSAWAIPVGDYPELFSNLSVRSAAGLHIARAPVIQWDERPCIRKAAWELCSTLLDALKTQHPCECRPEVLIFFGDFRQASRRVIVQSAVQSSSSWSRFTRYCLGRVWRQAEDASFCRWIDGIGGGAQATQRNGAGDGGFAPLRDIATVLDEAAAIRHAFPHLNEPHSSNSKILAVVNTLVGAHNERILRALERTFLCPAHHLLSADALNIDSAGLVEPHLAAEFFALQYAPGAPPHDLRIVVGGLFELMRNFSPAEQLMHRVPVIVKAVHHHHILIETLDGRQYPLPCFPLVDRQRPVHNGASAVSIASGVRLLMQPRARPVRATLDVRRSPVARGHLYVGFCRVKKRGDLRVLPDSENIDRNGNSLVRN
ncbi:unnamed protein product, partial [Prorocentrum cordatum]